jgi:hypothetical protein
VSSQLSKNIFQTIAYYDILNFPLTSFEVWKYLLAEDKFSLGEIVEVLDSGELKNCIEEFHGFYFLKSRHDLVARRIQNDKNSIVKFEIAERVAWWLRFVPYVRMAAVTGTLAMKNCERNSDIDFFVVLEKGRIFTGRLLVTLIVHLFGLRRHGKKIKNRICLNYFITTDNLEIQRQDMFAANEYSFIYPIFACPNRDAKRGGRGHNVFQKFCEVNVNWIKKFKPNWSVPDLKPARYIVEHSRISSSIQKLFENLINMMRGDRIEAWQKRRQIARIKRNPLTNKPGAYIEYNDKNLIFLPDPQGVRVEKEWQKRLSV